MVDEAGAEVALIGRVTCGELFGLLVEFVELPLGGGGIEPREAREGERGRAAREDELEALVEAAAGGLLAAGLQPKDAEGEDAVDGGGGL